VLKDDFSQPVIMRIDCPRCGQLMLVRVGLSPETARNQIECIDCKSLIVALAPGPVIGRPWKPDSAPPGASTCISVEM